MNIRMQYAKYGRMVWLGHLDVMRYFQKALRRAGVDLVYTRGFSPHPVLSFGAPLGVGIESCGEYADLEVNESGSTAEMVGRLNAVMVPGMKVLDWRELPDGAPNAMSCVAAADYRLACRKEDHPASSGEFWDRFRAFLQRDCIEAVKETKKGSRTVDVRPFLYEYEIRKEEEGWAFYLQVCTGSVDNTKPELFLSAFHEAAGLAWDKKDFQISRLETYFRNGDGGLIPLAEAGRVIP